jgi:hypothetical protein
MKLTKVRRNEFAMSGVNPWMGCPMMGSEGPVVQADGT